DLGILLALLRGFQQFRNGDGALAMCIAAAASAPWLVVFSLCVLGGRLNGIIAAGIPAHCLEGAGVEFLRLAVRFLLRLFFRLGRLLGGSICWLLICLGLGCILGFLVLCLARLWLRGRVGHPGLCGGIRIHLIEKFRQRVVIA